MLVLDKVFLTASARPVLLPGELERLLVDKASYTFQTMFTGLVAVGFSHLQMCRR